MADNVTFQSSTLATPPSGTIVSADQASGDNSLIQRMKLAYSADGSATHVTADADGLLVNLGTNNDVSVTGTVTVDGSAVTQPISAVSLPLPSGASTAANQSTANTALSAIQTAVELLDNTVSGTELQVDIVSAPTLTVDLGANNDVTIDNSSIVKAEDAAHNSGDAGVMALVVRNDTLGALAGADQDYAPLQVNADGALYSIGAGVAGSGNTSTTPLGSGATYTGTWETNQYPEVMVSCQTDNTGTLYFDFSNDGGTNSSTFPTNGFALASGIHEFHIAVKGPRSFRVRLVNDAGAQSYLRLYTYYGDFEKPNAPLNQSLGLDADAENVRAVIAGEDPGGSYQNVKVTSSGNFKIALEEYDGVPVGGGVESGALRVTIANNSTGVLSIDDNSGSLTVDNAGTFAVQVDAALPAGDNNIGNVDIVTMPGTAAEASALPSSFVVVAGDDGTDTHPLQLDGSGHLQVDIAADSVGIGGGTQYTEDDAAAANPVGNAVMLVRADTPATITSLDGDNVAQRATNYGAAYVQVVDSSGNFINSFGGSGGTSHADDAAFSIGSASSITPAGYLADDTTPDSVDEGDVGVPRMTLTRKPYAVITDATSENNAAVDGSGHLQVDIAADSVGIGGGTEYAVDAALGATPTGKLALGIRDDALSSLTPVEGDAVGLRVDANGALWVIPSGTVTVDGSGVTQPVSGTVTANLSATDNAVLDSIDAAVNGTLTVGSHAVTNAGTFVVQENGAALTALQLIDDTIFVDDTATHTAATTKVIGIGAVATPTDTTVDANDIAMPAMSTDRRLLVDAQIVGTDAALDVSAATVTVAGTGTFAVQAAQSGTWNVTNISGTVSLPTGAATAANQSTANTSLSNIETAVQVIDNPVVVDDAAFTPATTSVMMAGFEFDDVTPDSVNEGDAGAARMSANRNIYMQIRDAAGNERGANVNASNQLGVVATASDALLTTIDADTSTLAGAVAGSEMQVDVVGSLPAGDNNIGNVDIVSLPASTNTIEVVGDVAADAAAAGNPVGIGAVQETMADSAPSTRVSTDADASRIAASDGAIYTIPTGPQTWSYHSDGSAALTDATVHAAPGAGLSLYVTDIVFSSGAATAINAFFEEGASKVLGPYYLEAVAGRGTHIRFQTPKKVTANTALTVTTSAAIAHSVDVTGFIARG